MPPKNILVNLPIKTSNNLFEKVLTINIKSSKIMLVTFPKQELIMTKDELTTFQIDKETLRLLKELAAVDMRSGTKEIAWLIQSELARRGITDIRRLPAPEGGDAPILIGIGKNGDEEPVGASK
jgi:hypothetical protein